MKIDETSQILKVLFFVSIQGQLFAKKDFFSILSFKRINFTVNGMKLCLINSKTKRNRTIHHWCEICVMKIHSLPTPNFRYISHSNQRQKLVRIKEIRIPFLWESKRECTNVSGPDELLMLHLTKQPIIL